MQIIAEIPYTEMYKLIDMTTKRTFVFFEQIEQIWIPSTELTIKQLG